LENPSVTSKAYESAPPGKPKNLRTSAENLRVRALNIFLAPRNIPTKQFGNDFIAMDGGTRIGDPCEAKGHHGYHGIEKETVAAIKKWIKQGS